MNYTLKQLQDRVNKLIKDQGEDAPCAAWIYTADDCAIIDESGDHDYVCDKYPEITDRIFCLLYTSPSPRDSRKSRMPSSA